MERREKIRKTWFMVLVSVCFLVSAAEAKYSGGTGEPNDPYLISDVNDINEMRGEPNDWGGCFLMTADIDLAGAGDNPDGSFSTAVIAPDTDDFLRGFQGTAFSGVFDGNDFKITNLTIDDGGAGNDYLGLFGHIDGGLSRKPTNDQPCRVPCGSCRQLRFFQQNDIPPAQFGHVIGDAAPDHTASNDHNLSV